MAETRKQYVSEAVGALSGGDLIERKTSGILSAVYVLLDEDRLEDMHALAKHAQQIGRTRLARD